jgi:DNA gyrase subunit A
LVVTELPYQVNKAKLQERIAELVKEKRITGIQDIRDESSREGMRIVLVLKAGENPQVVENQLYKFTALESTFGITMLAVVGGKPQVLNLKELLSHFLDFRREVVARRTRYDLDQAEKRAHVLEGLKIALERLDEVIRVIRSASNPSEARGALTGQFGLSETQAQAILDMKLQRLTGLERDKILKEYEQVLQDIERYRQILTSPALIDRIIHEELEELATAYGDERRTEIVPAAGDIGIEDLIEEKSVIITLSRAGYIKRTPADTYRSQHRGGKGRNGMSVREEDHVRLLLTASTHDHLLVFTNFGRLYWLKVYEIPEVGPAAGGKAIVNLLPLQPEEKVAALLPVHSFDEKLFITTATRNGIVRRIGVDAFSKPRSTGVRAIVLDEGDSLVSACLTDGTRNLFFMSDAGRCIRVPEKAIKVSGRISKGVRAMDLGGAKLIGMDVIDDSRSILVVTENGFGKRTPATAYRTQKRGGKGVSNIKVTPKNGKAVTFCQISDDDEIFLTTNNGRMIRIPVAGIRETGRVAQGLRLIDIGEGERIVDVAVA